jgi:hypothetical protein
MEKGEGEEGEGGGGGRRGGEEERGLVRIILRFT